MELYQDKEEDELTHLIKDSWDIKTIVEESQIKESSSTPNPKPGETIGYLDDEAEPKKMGKGKQYINLLMQLLDGLVLKRMIKQQMDQGQGAELEKFHGNQKLARVYLAVEKDAGRNCWMELKWGSEPFPRAHKAILVLTEYKYTHPVVRICNFTKGNHKQYKDTLLKAMAEGYQMQFRSRFYHMSKNKFYHHYACLGQPKEVHL